MQTLAYILGAVITDKFAQSIFRHVTANNFAVGNGSRGVEHHVFISKLFNYGRKLCKIYKFFFVTSDEAYNFQFAFGDGTSFIRKEDVQAPCRFDAYKLTHQYVVVEHLTHI